MNRILLALILLSGAAHCTSIDISLASHHFSSGKSQQNEQNYGLGMTTESLSFGFYKNSFYKTSVYLTGNAEAKQSWGSVGILYGGVTGYKDNIGAAILPVLLPYVTLGAKGYRARIGVTPVVITFQILIDNAF